MKTFTLEEVLALLNSNSPKQEAARLVLQVFGELRTSDVAEFLGWDRSNTGRRLEALVEDGLAEIVDEAHHDGKQGRPTRLWAAI
jgi:predicted ArsR family transcriptional regulator